MEYSKPQKEKYYNQTGGYTKGGYNTGYKKVTILNKYFIIILFFFFFRTTTKEAITQTTITINQKMKTTLNLKFSQSTLLINFN